MSGNFDPHLLAQLDEPANRRATELTIEFGYTLLKKGGEDRHQSFDLSGRRRSGRTTTAVMVANLAESYGLKTAFVVPLDQSFADEVRRLYGIRCDVIAAPRLSSGGRSHRYQVIVVDDADHMPKGAEEKVRGLRAADDSLTLWVRDAPHPAP